MDLLELFKIADKLYSYSNEKISFDAKGWPIFKREYFLDEWPQDMVTYVNRTSHLISPSKDTLLCFYMSDEQIYRRFAKFERDIPIYKQFKGVVFPDITVTFDMDKEMQEMIMLINQLFAAALAANGVKIVFNTRNGSKFTTKYFENIPKQVMCASSFLGCNNAKDIFSATPYINKILDLMPKKLIIYGKHDFVIDSQLDVLGIDYKYFTDFHTRCKLSYNKERRAS